MSDVGTNNFNRDVKGIPEQDYLDISSTKQFPLGTRYRRYCGRTFHYAQAAAVALVSGNLIQTATLGGATTTVQHDLTPAACAAGTYTVTAAIDTTEQPANTYQDGWMAVTDGDAANAMGDLYLVKSHPLSATNIILTLYDPLKRAITTSSRISLMTNQYKAVIQAPVTTPTGFACGVCPTVVTASYYFWLQTWGMCNVLDYTATTMGTNVLRDVTAAGSVGVDNGVLATEQIGFAGIVTDTTDSGLVYLMIAP